MAPSKPRNHATEEMAKRLKDGGKAGPIPEIDLTLLEFLERLFPPRCYTAEGESLEDHLQYAGAVALVQCLRTSYEEQANFTDDGGDDATTTTIFAMGLNDPDGDD